MKRLSFHQIKPAFDTFDPLIEPIHAPMNARNTFFDMRGADLEVLNVVNKAVDALFHSRQSRLDLLQHRHDDVGDFTHANKHIRSRVVPQGA